MSQRILVVDDEPHIRHVICFAIERAGLACATARNGAEAMMAFRRGHIDLIVLDIGMPEMDGLDVCCQILFLSARDEEIDRVLGLEIGGDDYVTKPFSPRELVARVKAILKRTGGDVRRENSLAAGRISLDRGGRSVRFGDIPVALTALEFSILETLIARPELVFSREQLMEAAYGPGIYVADRTIDSHIRNIRAKFSAAGAPGVIVTVHGIGFQLSPDAEGKA